MNEEKTKKIHRKKAREEQAKKQRSFANKLKTDEDKRAYVGNKLRVGKADKSETKVETRKNKSVRTIGKKQAVKKSYDIVSVSKNRVIRSTSDDNKHNSDESVSGVISADVIDSSAYLIDNAATEITQKYSKKLYSKRHLSNHTNYEINHLHSKNDLKVDGNNKVGQNANDIPLSENGPETSNVKSRETQHNQMKKRIQKESHEVKRGNSSTQAFERTGIGEKIKEFFAEIEKKVAEWISEHPISAIFALLLLIIVLVLTGTMSSCSMLGNGASDVTIATTFTADDEDILNVEKDYRDKEEDLRQYIEEFETNNPGYDEYQYNLAEIGHNPFELAALLTVLYEDYTQSEVQEMLDTIYENQYEIVPEERIEIRNKTVVNEDTGETETIEYEYKILTLTVINNGIDKVARSLLQTEDELARYELLLETYGNKKYLFEYDIYSILGPGGPYEIPAEFLTDEEFARLIKEAEKYLGMKYVWGGSSPSEGFDCSGFVSYVLNHCGNGINVGRPTANGLANMCAKISGNNAKPGDLVFFKNTYEGAPSGASHVGIYVGNGMMIHCGNPIQYTSIETPFWQNHLYTYGRVNR